MYYKSNALYEHIGSNNINNFEFVSGNLWQLVYGDREEGCKPKLLVLVSGVNKSQVFSCISNKETLAYKRMSQLGRLSGLPVIFIRFCIDENEVENVYLCTSNGTFISETMLQLTTIFSNYGLPVSAGETAKYLNDKESSAYHKWQRGSLGRNIIVSDLDLLKINLRNNSIEIVYELKRSHKSMIDWAPYIVDYNNFRLLGNLLNNTGILFKIAYNVRKTNPYKDDISTIKIYNVDVNSDSLVSFEGIVSLNDFINS